MAGVVRSPHRGSMRRSLFGCATVLASLALVSRVAAEPPPARTPCTSADVAACGAPRRRARGRQHDRPRDLPRHRCAAPEGRAPRIDGRLDDAAWQLAQPAGDFIQREPIRRASTETDRVQDPVRRPERSTSAIWAFDSDPDGILASEMKRDSGLRKGDQIKIIIDTFHDQPQRLLLLHQPARRLQGRPLTDNGRIINYDWNAVWECKTSRDEHGWYAEIAIPLSQLRFKTSLDETVVGPEHLPRSSSAKTRTPTGCPSRANGPVGFARMQRRPARGLAICESRRQLEFVPFSRRRSPATTTQGRRRRTTPVTASTRAWASRRT